MPRAPVLAAVTLAAVGKQPITREQLDRVVEHFSEEAKREGKPFPPEDSPRFRSLRRSLLGLLVYRAELDQTARRLGVRVTKDEIERRLSGGGEEADSGDKEGAA